MCIIIFKKAESAITRGRLENAYQANPDGWGIMTAIDGKLHTAKGIHSFYTFYKQYQFYESELTDWQSDIAIHFRTASSGAISLNACHPFHINHDVAFMQNGNFFEFSGQFPGIDATDGLTDVQRFNEMILKRLPGKIPEQTEIENYCAHCQSKMVFMDSNGNSKIINEGSGHWIDGTWYSNGGIKDYVGYGYSGAYYYNAGDIRHKGGLLSIQMLPQRQRNNWKRCSVCLGWFPKDVLTGNICRHCVVYLTLTNCIRGDRLGI